MLPATATLPIVFVTRVVDRTTFTLESICVCSQSSLPYRFSSDRPVFLIGGGACSIRDLALLPAAPCTASTPKWDIHRFTSRSRSIVLRNSSLRDAPSGCAVVFVPGSQSPVSTPCVVDNDEAPDMYRSFCYGITSQCSEPGPISPRVHLPLQ